MMKKVTVELTPGELEMVLNCLSGRADELRTYLTWVDQRPHLPAKDVAFAEVRSEIERYRALWLNIVKQDEAGRRTA